jgi:hypothetical protein
MMSRIRSVASSYLHVSPANRSGLLDGGLGHIVYPNVSLTVPCECLQLVSLHSFACPVCSYRL